MSATTGSDNKSNQPEPTHDVRVSINGRPLVVPEGISVLDACARAGVTVPTLCHHPRLPPSGKCGVCVVEIAESSTPDRAAENRPGAETETQNETGAAAYKLACSTKVSPGMSIRTDTQGLWFGSPYLGGVKARSSAAIRKMMSLAPGYMVRSSGDSPMISHLKDIADVTVEGGVLAESDCISCGQCSTFCPVGAITERDETAEVIKALEDPKLIPVLQTAPSPRVAISECFGGIPGSIETSRIIGAAKQIGFKYVFDTNFGADLTIVEEGTELLHRIQQGGPFPMFTSCCPAWINLIEKKYPKLLSLLSSCKSPMMMLAPIVKTYFAQMAHLDPRKIYQVALMPCTAKKEEIRRPQLLREGQKDVDVVLTTREFARLLAKKGIDWKMVIPSEYDDPLGQSSGAAQIFGATGGVMEAALRTAYELYTGKPLLDVDFTEVRGFEGLKEATVNLSGLRLNIAVLHGAANVRSFLDKLDTGNKKYHFVEIMCCTGGCIGGGGQPQSEDELVLQKRAKGIYSIDEMKNLRKSHENPAIQNLYEHFLKAPGSHVAHKLLHTSYTNRGARPSIDKGHKVQSAAGAGLLILYGSQGGATAAVARDLVGEVEKAGFTSARCQTLNSYNVSALSGEPTVMVLCSTFAEGELPDNAKKFYEELNKCDKGILSGLHYSVCGFGSTAYPKFCEAGKMIDSLLEAHGAERVVETALVDEKTIGNGMESYYDWVKQCVEAFGGAGEALNDPPVPKLIVSLGVAVGRKYKKPCPPGFHFIRFMNSSYITAEGYDRPAKLFDFDLRNSGVSYNVGDHAYLLPRNAESSVLPLLDFLGLSAATMINLTPASSSSGDIRAAEQFPSQLNIGELFCQYLDIFAPVTKKFLSELVKFAADPSERNMLMQLTVPRKIGEDPSSNQAMEEAQVRSAEFVASHSFADSLIRFPSAVPPLANLISMVPLIRPRAYSIASSPNAFQPRGSVMQLAVVLYKYRTASGQAKEGLCTSYLFSLKNRAQTAETTSSTPQAEPVTALDDSSLVALRVRRGILLPPQNPAVPIVMIGLGTGIAPFRGFLQEREFLLSSAQSSQSQSQSHAPSPEPTAPEPTSSTTTAPQSHESLAPRPSQGNYSGGGASPLLGPALLFFGCRHRDSDYFFRDELSGYKASGALMGVDAAFSHDQAHFVFVQDRIRGAAPEATRLALADLVARQGCRVYYCGPAMGVPQQVLQAVKDCLRATGGWTEQQADRLIEDMLREKRISVEAY
ncbi:Fe-hydrogenase 2 [Pelomyxa schiedti]|nr:Fe-hydrogenase 2 [Pelomyxa schiedti]